MRSPSLHPAARLPAPFRVPVARPSARRPAALAALLAGVLTMLAAVSAAAAPVQLTLRCRDLAGQPLAVRARVAGSDHASYPPVPNAALLASMANGGYFYLDGEAVLSVPPGETRITIGRGFEWRTADTIVVLERDTVITVPLARFTELDQAGWYPGDVHVHMMHPPIEYAITPEIAKRVARSEGLAVTHLLDEAYEFTGAPHALSDSANILYFSYEFRNQTWGHVSIPGLQSPVDDECCLAPASPLPMNMDVADQVHAGTGGLFTLAHPHTTGDSSQFCCWPGVGLGRELPVLAALGRLDAMELASFSNDPDLDLADWYDLLAMGFAPVPVAGTDAVINWTNQSPPGGWRVYAKLERGAEFGYGPWLDAVRAGRTFVTSYPLIPEFSVNGVEPGDVLEEPGDTVVARVHLRVQSAISIRRVALVADGVEIWSRPWTTWPPIYDKDTTLTITMPTPAWMNLVVESPIGHPHAVYRPPTAVTNAVRFTRGGVPRRIPSRAQRWLDELDELQAVIEARGGWASPAEHDSVLARIERARDVYRRLGEPEVVLASPPPVRREAPRAWPNPSFGAVNLQGFGGAVDVFDMSGRRVAHVEPGRAMVWDGRDGRGMARPGLYLARSEDGRRTLRIVRLR